MAITRIGVLTSGGEGSGMNAAIRSVVRTADHRGLEVYGIYRGFSGLLNEEIAPLDHRSVSNIVNRGGTFLKTSRCPEFRTEEGRRRGLEVLRAHKIDGLIVIGGNGSYQGALALCRESGFPCIGVPGTIDNDINGTDATIGSDTAVNTALDAIDKIRDTATSLERIFVVEVMGRECGFIAMQVAVAGGAEEVLLPERPFQIEQLSEQIVEGNLRGKVSWIIIVAEGAAKGADVARQINEITGLETREVTLGHIQRGGTPTAQDRLLGARLGNAAVDLLLKGECGKAVGVKADELHVVDLEYAVTKKDFKFDELYSLLKILT